MARKEKPISSLSKRQIEKRRVRRALKFRSDEAFERWLKKHRNLPPDDPRHIRPGIRDDDFVQLNRIRQVSKRYKTGAERLLEKKRILVDTANLPNHMSAFAFLDRYMEQILALLRDSNTTEYRKRQLRKMKKELDQRINAGDIGRPRQLDLWEQYHGN